jgi:hypothetical protein
MLTLIQHIRANTEADTNRLSMDLYASHLEKMQGSW